MTRIIKFVREGDVIFKLDINTGETRPVDNMDNIDIENQFSHITNEMTKLGWMVAIDDNHLYCAKRM